MRHVKGSEVDEEDLRTRSDLDEVDFGLRWLLVVQLLWWMTVFKVERNEGRICIEE